MKSVLVLQHEECETLGVIQDSLDAQDIRADYVRVYEGEHVPRYLASETGLIVMGGPMSAYEVETYPFLADEISLIEQAVDRKLPVLGVCLGSQLLASALGSKVYPGKAKEIGWFPITLSDASKDDPLMSGLPKTFTGLHWHGDTYDLPLGATSLASSELTAVQAYRYGKSVYGIQFHMEVTAKMIDVWTFAFEDDLTHQGLESNAITGPAKEFLEGQQVVARQVFGRWAELVA